MLAGWLTHFFIPVRVDGCVSDGSPEPGRRSRRPHFTLGVGVLPSQPKVQHEYVSHGLGSAAHGEVGGLDVPVEEAHVVNGLDALEDLIAETERGGEREGPPGLGATQLRQVLALKLHDHVVEAVVAAAPDEPADVVPTLELLEHGHLHLEDLLGLLGRLQLERHLLLGHEVDALVDLPEAAAADFPGDFPSLLDDVSWLEEIFCRGLARHPPGCCSHSCRCSCGTSGSV